MDDFLDLLVVNPSSALQESNGWMCSPRHRLLAWLGVCNSNLFFFLIYFFLFQTTHPGA